MKLNFIGTLIAALCVSTPLFAAPGYLGVYLTDDDRGRSGALVEGVEPGSPAAREGIRRGDRIVAINGTEIRNSAELIPHLVKGQAGQTLELRMTRKGWGKTVKVRLGARPAATPAPKVDPPTPDAIEPAAKAKGFLGIFLEESEGDAAVVESVMPNSAAQRAGFRAGDRILSVGGKPVTDPTAVITYLGQYGPNQTVTVGIKRRGKGMTLRPTLSTRPADKAMPAPEARPAQPDPTPSPSAKRPGFIGVSLEDNDGRGPLKVDDVRANSPAERFGLRKGDVVVQVQATKTKTIEDFVKAVKGLYAGDTATFKIERDGWRSTVRLTLGAQPKD